MKKTLQILALTLSLGVFLTGCEQIKFFEKVETDDEKTEEVDTKEDEKKEETKEGDTEKEDTKEAKNTKSSVFAGEEEIAAAFEEKYPDWDISNQTIVISSSGEGIASGTIFDDTGMGGWWYAAQTDGEWEIVADGNGDVMCNDIEPYGFPTDWIPSCWDETNQEMIKRGEAAADPIGETDEFITEEEVLYALAHQYGDVFDTSDYLVEIEQSTATHAAGSLMYPTGDGGYFLMYNDGSEWKVASSGDGVVECIDVDPYDFPEEMVPECWDSVQADMVKYGEPRG